MTDAQPLPQPRASFLGATAAPLTRDLEAMDAPGLAGSPGQQPLRLLVDQRRKAPGPRKAGPRPGRFQALARKGVLARLAGLEAGCMVFHEPWSEMPTAVGVTGSDLPDVHIEVRSPAFWLQLARGGAVGAGEAWMDGHWHTDDPAGAVRIMVRNRDVLSSVDRGLVRLVRPLRKLWHAMRPNTLAGSRRNIAAHYDLGNDFFRLFLDETMTYSAGVFEYPGQPLRDASLAKLDRLCRKLDLGSKDHLIEIGTGWGSMAIHAATHYGCRVTTTTISAEQHRLATERVAAAGLSDRVEVVQQDYRELAGQYDKLVSVEMIEAVGHQFLPTYMAKLAELLKPGGLAALQVIHIADQHYERARREVDFIKRYIFPGCFIPSIQAIQSALTRHTDFRLVDLEEIGPHYAETLRRWRGACEDRHREILAQGLPESFHRMWTWYLAYCEGGFDERYLGTAQLLFAKPLARPRDPVAGLPPSRAWDPAAAGGYLWPLDTDS